LRIKSDVEEILTISVGAPSSCLPERGSAKKASRGNSMLNSGATFLDCSAILQAGCLRSDEGSIFFAGKENELTCAAV
jgi:hypothetical protein